MANHKKTETAAKLKKFYSTMSNAVKLAELQEGKRSYEWDWGGQCNYATQKTLFENYILPQINYIKIEQLPENDTRLKIHVEHGYVTDSAAVYLNDGSMFFASECNDNIAYDVNGDKGPNEFGRDIFTFFILSSDDSGTADVKLLESIPHFNTVAMYPMPWENNGSELKSTYNRANSITNCKKDDGRVMGCCTHIVELDGWTFKDDYPWRL